jgi:hypothetical protein
VHQVAGKFPLADALQRGGDDDMVGVSVHNP